MSGGYKQSPMMPDPVTIWLEEGDGAMGFGHVLDLGEEASNDRRFSQIGSWLRSEASTPCSAR
jgi:hypothetical protein